MPGAGGRWRAAAEPPRPAGDPHADLPAHQAKLLDTWNPIGLRGTASDSYTVEGVFVPEAFSSTREDPSLRREPGPLYAFTQQGLYAVGSPAWRWARRGRCLQHFMALAMAKAPRGQSLLAEDAVVQAEVARATASWVRRGLGCSGCSARCTTPPKAGRRYRWRSVPELRLGCAHAIQAAVEVTDFAYKSPGVDAIFPGSPSERRFRDIQPPSQQIQARAVHFAAVGQVLLGRAPAGFL